MLVTISKCHPAILEARVLDNRGRGARQMVPDSEVTERYSSTDSEEEKLMFYSASQSLIITQTQAQERAISGPSSPVNRVERSRWSESRRIDRVMRAVTAMRARRWFMPRANVTGKA